MPKSPFPKIEDWNHVEWVDQKHFLDQPSKLRVRVVVPKQWEEVFDDRPGKLSHLRKLLGHLGSWYLASTKNFANPLHECIVGSYALGEIRKKIGWTASRLRGMMEVAADWGFVHRSKGPGPRQYHLDMRFFIREPMPLTIGTGVIGTDIALGDSWTPLPPEKEIITCVGAGGGSSHDRIGEIMVPRGVWTVEQRKWLEDARGHRVVLAYFVGRARQNGYGSWHKLPEGLGALTSENVLEPHTEEQVVMAAETLARRGFLARQESEFDIEYRVIPSGLFLVSGLDDPHFKLANLPKTIVPKLRPKHIVPVGPKVETRRSIKLTADQIREAVNAHFNVSIPSGAAFDGDSAPFSFNWNETA